MNGDERWNAADAAVLTALLGVILVALLASPPIMTRGEAREGLVVRSIVREHEWILPRREGKYASKPPLYHWTSAGLAAPLGLSDAVVRLPSALAAWVMVLVTFGVGFGMGGRVVGWLAVGALVGMWGFWRSALEARVDMLFAASVTGALAAFWRWYRSGAGGARVGFYAAVAAAVLTKGPAGAVLPVLVVAGFLCWQRELRTLLRLWSTPSALAAGALVGCWYLAATRRGGSEFVAVQLVQENVARFVGTGNFVARRWHHPLKLLGSFLGHLFPWNLALIGAVPRAHAASLEAPERFLHAWWLIVLGVFSIAAGKRSVYLLPLYPAIAVLAGRALAGWRALCHVGVARAGVAVVASGMASAVLTARWWTAEGQSVAALAEDVRRHVPAEARISIGNGVTENDHLVLAYQLDRSLAQVPFSSGPAGYVLVAEPGARKAGAPCSTLLSRKTDHSGVLSLLQCHPR